MWLTARDILILADPSEFIFHHPTYHAKYSTDYNVTAKAKVIRTNGIEGKATVFYRTM